MKRRAPSGGKSTPKTSKASVRAEAKPKRKQELDAGSSSKRKRSVKQEENSSQSKRAKASSGASRNPLVVIFRCFVYCNGHTVCDQNRCFGGNI